MADVDKDGRLSREEFVLSGHLCDMAAKGEPLPAALPPHLVPPSLRPGRVPGAAVMPVAAAGSVAGSGSVAGDSVGTPGSVKDLNSPSTFEDKRRENFNKGQAELERRRQSIIEMQKKEEEERKKKEKEEAEEKERQK